MKKLTHAQAIIFLVLLFIAILLIGGILHDKVSDLVLYGICIVVAFAIYFVVESFKDSTLPFKKLDHWQLYCLQAVFEKKAQNVPEEFVIQISEFLAEYGCSVESSKEGVIEIKEYSAYAFSNILSKLLSNIDYRYCEAEYYKYLVNGLNHLELTSLQQMTTGKNVPYSLKVATLLRHHNLGDTLIIKEDSMSLDIAHASWDEGYIITHLGAAALELLT